MIIKWFKHRQVRRLEQRVQAAKAKLEAEKLIEDELIKRGTELKEVLIVGGVIPFSRINRNLSDQYVSMFGVLNGRLVRGDMGIKGYFLIKYVGEG